MSRSSASKSTPSCRRAPRSSAAAARRSVRRRIRRSVRSASGCPVRCRSSTGRPSTTRSRRRSRSAATCSRVDLRAQELLLSGPAEGLPDLAVRAAARPRRRPRGARRRRGALDRSDAHPHGGGRRQVAARRLLRLRAPHLRRLQPQRRAAHRDRHRARHALRGRGGGVLQPAARHARLARRQRRQHGRGQPALRRQRLGAAGRPQTKFGTKAEVKNLNSFRYRAEGDRVRDRSADRSARRRRPRRAGNAALGFGGRPHACRCAARKKRTTIATSPNPICRRWSSTRRGSSGSAATMPELPEARRRRFVAAYGVPDYDAGVLTQSAGAGRLLRGDGRGRRQCRRPPATG